MANRKRWSSTVGSTRGKRVRVFERTPGGTLYCAVWIPGDGISRRSLGHADRKRALKEAAELAALRAKGEAAQDSPLTLDGLLARYLAQSTHSREGSLKTEHYRRDCAQRARFLTQWFGAACGVTMLTPDRMQAYVRARRSGEVSGTPVRTRSVQCDLKFLKSVLHWATGVFDNGVPLLERNPLSGFSPPCERDPRRPLVEADTVAALQAVAEAVNPQLPLLIVLVDTTGRRLSSVLGLRWDDFDFDRGRIRWRAELDKSRRASETPTPKAALASLLALRRERPAIGAALLFPHPKRSMAGQAVTRHLASYWLNQAYEVAGVPRPTGSLWHAFRRRWATTRKHLSLKDVAAAGGWHDLTTLLTCYQQPDEDTMRAVVDYQPVTKAGNN
jgi:integrase